MLALPRTVCRQATFCDPTNTHNMLHTCAALTACQRNRHQQPRDVLKSWRAGANVLGTIAAYQAEPLPRILDLLENRHIRQRPLTGSADAHVRPLCKHVQDRFRHDTQCSAILRVACCISRSALHQARSVSRPTLRSRYAISVSTSARRLSCRSADSMSLLREKASTARLTAPQSSSAAALQLGPT